MKEGDLVICIKDCASEGKLEPCSKGSIHKLSHVFRDDTLGLKDYVNIFKQEYFKVYKKLIFKTYI